MGPGFLSTLDPETYRILSPNYFYKLCTSTRELAVHTLTLSIWAFGGKGHALCCSHQFNVEQEAAMKHVFIFLFLHTCSGQAFDEPITIGM